MTNQPNGTQIDPDWWEAALHDPDDDVSLAGWTMPELASTELRLLAEACRDRDSLKARTLQALADVTSAKLAPDHDGEPFMPAMTWDARRTILPRDLDDDQYALLTAAAPLISNPLIRARAADATWTYGPVRDRTMLMAAVDAYLEIPLTSDAWRRVGENSWRRAISLLRSQSGATRDRLLVVREKLLNRLLTSTLSDGWMAVEIGELLRRTGRVAPDLASAAASHLEQLASDDNVNARLKRHLYRGARTWHASVGEHVADMRCTVEIS